MVERVGTYTGSSTVGRLPAATATPATRAPASSSGARGSASSGPPIGSVMGGYRGLSLATGADTEHGERLEAYRRLLTPTQSAVFANLLLEARDWGRVPDYALEVMAPHAPWPDPFEDTCEECEK